MGVAHPGTLTPEGLVMQAVLFRPAGHRQCGSIHPGRLLRHRPGRGCRVHEHQPHGLGWRRQSQDCRESEGPGLPPAHG